MIAVKAIHIGVAMLMSVSMAACGGSDSEKSEPTTPPTTAAKSKPKPNPGPRVVGTWRVIYRPRNHDAAVKRATWFVTPTCAVGACAIRVHSSLKWNPTLRYDKAADDYTFTKTYRRACGDGTGKIVIKHGYVERRQLNLRPVQERTINGRLVAVKMIGRDTSTWQTKKAAATAGCSDQIPSTLTSGVTAVRLSGNLLTKLNAKP